MVKLKFFSYECMPTNENQFFVYAGGGYNLVNLEKPHFN